jgi:cytochrome c oxidase cbb3-type subunit I/II
MRGTRGLGRWAALGLFAAVLLFSGAASAQESHIGKLTGHDKEGKALYKRFCLGCHGIRGDGQGENAPFGVGGILPRDFTTGLFKCRSTPSGSIPLDSDLFDTITRGVHTTAMPTWIGLTKQQRADLIAYIKTFSPRFKEEKPEAPVKIPAETPNTPDSAKRGEVLYQKTLKCLECHGAGGRGDGPSAATLRDNKGNPIPPYDFTTGVKFKCGETNEDLYRIFMTGLDGTPMPAWIDSVNPNQAWDLVHYLRTLQTHYNSEKAKPAGPKAGAKSGGQGSISR